MADLMSLDNLFTLAIGLDIVLLFAIVSAVQYFQEPFFWRI